VAWPSRAACVRQACTCVCVCVCVEGPSRAARGPAASSLDAAQRTNKTHTHTRHGAPMCPSIAATSSTSYCVTNDSAQPGRPARAVRPTLWAARVVRGVRARARASGRLDGVPRTAAAARSANLSPSHLARPPPQHTLHTTHTHHTHTTHTLHTPVHVVCRQVWQVIVDHQVDRRDVQPARRDVRC
jgi:hypothetical protein